MKVLLVDDEYIVLKGMEAMLSAQKEVELTLFTANDALEGLEIIPQISPDVIIADINMPEMDGLTMVEEARKKGYRGKFMIVSGYEKVEYLKRAIRQQAVDYLLKPVDKVQLIKRLKEIAQEKEKQQEDLLLKLKLCILDVRHLYDTVLYPEEIQSLFPARFLWLCTVHGSGNWDMYFNTQLSPYFEKILCFPQEDSAFFLLNSDREISKEEIRQLWSEIPQTKNWMLGISPARTVSDFIQELTNFKACKIHYEALADMLCHGLANCASIDYFAFPNPCESLETILNASQNEIFFQQYFNALLRDTDSLQQAHEKAFIEIGCYSTAIFGLPLDASILAANFQAQRQYIADCQSLYHMLKNILFNFFYYAPSFSAKQGKYSEKIYQAVLFIQKNHNRDLSLEEAAGAVQLHPSYFSTMFKKETGLTFLQYLHEERMDHACRLLMENPNLSIEQIAKLAGYNTSTYFHRIFRNQFGMSPNQWRSGE